METITFTAVAVIGAEATAEDIFRCYCNSWPRLFLLQLSLLWTVLPVKIEQLSRHREIIGWLRLFTFGHLAHPYFLKRGLSELSLSERQQIQNFWCCSDARKPTVVVKVLHCQLASEV